MPEMWMDVDAALAEVPVNILPLIDDTDFKAREVSIAYDAAGMDLVWNFVTTAGAFTQTAVTPTTAGVYDWTHQGDGMYTIEIPASAGGSINNDIEGFGWFSGFVTGVLPWRGPVIGFRAAALNNALIDGGDNLDVNVAQWLAQAVTLSTGNKPDVNVDEISDDATAPQNLELQYDTTGLTGDTFPATQAQVGNIASGTAATNTTAASVTVTTGVEVNAVTDTVELNGTVHEVNPSGGNTEFYYEFNVGANGVPVSVEWKGHANSNNDSYAIYAYNWSGAAWEQVGTITAVNGSTLVTELFDLTTGHVGTGANVGLVRWRPLSTDGTGFNTDRILCSFATVFQSVGYDDGAIWYDDGVSNTDTEIFVDGVADNPVSTWAAVKTLVTSTGLHRVHIANGSTVTLDANSDNLTLLGEGWVLALGGQSVVSAFIRGAVISGIATGSGYTLENCELGAVTMAPGTHNFCRYTDVATGFTFGSTGTFFINDPRSGVPGNTAPIFTWDASGTTKANFRGASCGIQFEAMSAGDVATVEGFGQIVEGTCTGGAVTVRGLFTLTGITNITLTDDARIDTLHIADEVLKRGVSNVQDAADTTSLAAVILGILESSVSGTTWTIRKTGGTTFVTKTVTVDAAADPITGVT